MCSNIHASCFFDSNSLCCCCKNVYCHHRSVVYISFPFFSILVIIFILLKCTKFIVKYNKLSPFTHMCITVNFHVFHIILCQLTRHISKCKSYAFCFISLLCSYYSLCNYYSYTARDYRFIIIIL